MVNLFCHYAEGSEMHPSTVLTRMVKQTSFVCDLKTVIYLNDY